MDMEHLEGFCDGKICKTCILKREKMCSGDQDNSTMDNWCKHEFIFGSNPRGRLSSPNAFRDVYNDSNYQRYDVINARQPNTEKEVPKALAFTICFAKLSLLREGIQRLVRKSTLARLS